MQSEQRTLRDWLDARDRTAADRHIDAITEGILRQRPDFVRELVRSKVVEIAPLLPAED